MIILPLLLLSHYFIAIKEKGASPTEDLGNYLPFEAPAGKFYADPFLFKYQGVNYLFFEDCNYKKGVISVVKIDHKGISTPQIALELSTHLSFPYVFSDGEEIYLLPETYDYKSVSLFRCVEFPHRWERVKTLVRGEHYSDPILFRQGGYYWLFTAVHRERLRIYYAKELMGKFTPHPVNRSGIKGRNAGAVFWHEGKWIRPVMDCTGKYGRAVIFKEILKLSPDEFVEKELFKMEPNWAPGLVGTHAYSQSEDLIAYDGERL